MFPNFRSRKQSEKIDEQHSFGGLTPVSYDGNKLVSRRGILTAGITLSASGWHAGNSGAAAEEELSNDSSPAVEVNVRNQATTLAESSPVIARLVREKKLVIAGGVYDLSTGKVAPVELPQLESEIQS